MRPVKYGKTRPSMAGMILAMGLLLGHSAFSEYVLVICVLFTAMFFGLVGLNLARMRDTREEVPPFDIDQVSGGVMPTFTGPLRTGEAKLQLMIIPAAVTIGLLALAAIDLWDRAHPV